MEKYLIYKLERDRRHEETPNVLRYSGGKDDEKREGNSKTKQ